MTFNAHLTSFAGRPVAEVPADGVLPAADGPVSWRFAMPSDKDFQEGEFAAGAEALSDFVARSGAAIESLVIGAWGYAAFRPAPIDLLVSLAPGLPRLRALFLGDITFEECEVSWMKVGDVSPLLTAFPALEVFGCRGGEDFRFSPVRHENLRTLTVQSGGLAKEFVTAVLGSGLPALTELELWLGTGEYGGDTTTAELAPLLAGTLFPGLTRLGLRNAEDADAIAAALAGAPVVARLERLDLSLGTLGDAGADALLAGQPLTHLAELDLHRHYLTDDRIAAVRAALPAVTVDLSQQETPEEEDDFRYVAVSE